MNPINNSRNTLDITEETVTGRLATAGILQQKGSKQ
jgi:hypothetical protein